MPPNNNQYVVVKPASVASSKPEAFSPEWMLFSFLKEFTPEDIESAINSNLQLDFSAMIGMVENYVVDEILKKFETFRPDLHKVLSKTKGKDWLKTQIRNALTNRS